MYLNIIKTGLIFLVKDIPIASFVNSNGEDDLFHGLLSATQISTMQLQDEYTSKENICNPLQ